MRTARVLTVSPSMLCTGWGGGCLLPGGLLWGCVSVYLVLVLGCLLSGGVPGPGVSALGGVSAPRGCTWSRGCLLRGVYLVPGGAPGPGGCVPGLGRVSAPRGVSGLGECTWSWGCVCSWGMYLVWGVSAPGGCLLRGGVRYSPVNRMTNRCKNITLPQTSFAGGNNAFLEHYAQVCTALVPCQ